MQPVDPLLESANIGPHSLAEGSLRLPDGRDIDIGQNMQVQGRAWRPHPRSTRFYAGKLGQLQALTVNDTSSMTARVILEEVFGLAREEAKLMACVSSKPMPKLVMRYYIATQGSADRAVPKGKEAVLNLQAYTPVDLECHKNIAHVAAFDEDQMMTEVPIYSIGQDDAALSIGAARNLDIAAALATATEIATGHDWGEVTTGVSDHNPILDIAAGIAAMATKTTNDDVKANPSILAMNPLVWADLVQNTHISTYLDKGLMRLPAPGVETGFLGLPMYPNLSLLIDSDLLSTSAFLVDPKYVLEGEGPQQSVGYRHELAGYDGHLLRDYCCTSIVTGATYTLGVRELTGVHA